MPDEPAVIPGSVRIPCFRDASPSVTYVLPTPERVAEIAKDVGAAMKEYHYEATAAEPERWILTVAWETPGVRFSAQGPQTAKPYLPGGDDA